MAFLVPAGAVNAWRSVQGIACVVGQAVARPRLFNKVNHALLGACRIGTDPQLSVVDADCRPNDASRLWSCGGSVLPTAVTEPHHPSRRHPHSAPTHVQDVMS